MMKSWKRQIESYRKIIQKYEYEIISEKKSKLETVIWFRTPQTIEFQRGYPVSLNERYKTQKRLFFLGLYSLILNAFSFGFEGIIYLALESPGWRKNTKLKPNKATRSEECLGYSRMPSTDPPPYFSNTFYMWGKELLCKDSALIPSKYHMGIFWVSHRFVRLQIWREYLTGEQ